jgi:hypothetical protein
VSGGECVDGGTDDSDFSDGGRDGDSDDSDDQWQ